MSFNCLQVLSAAGITAAKKSGHEYLFRCPRHDDRSPSLSVNEVKDCWMCGPCGQDGNSWQLAAFVANLDPDNKGAVLTWLEDHELINGFKRKEPDSPWKVIKSYAYHNEDGSVAFHIDRLESVVRGIRKKKFAARPEGAKKILYNLPAVLSATTIYVVEGEKCADALIEHGFVATTNPFGAKKWIDSYNSYFKPEQNVVIFPDNDKPGQAHADQVANALVGRVASVKICKLPLVNDREDIYDFLAARTIQTAADQIARIVSQTPDFIPPTTITGDPESPEGDRWDGSFNENAMADWIVAKHPEIVFNIDTKKWLYFNDSYWVEDSARSKVSDLVSQEVLSLHAQAAAWFVERQQKEFYKFLLGCGDARHINAILELASRKATSRSSAFDADPYLVNFPNGTLELRTGILREHRFDDRITRSVPWAIDEEIETPAWDNFVNFLCQGDKDFYMYLYRALGYCLSGDMSQHCMFLLWGPALNGKTTLIDTMIDLLGTGYARKASIQMLVRRDDDCNPELAYCDKMRFVGVSEGMNRRIDEELVKAITTGEWITTRQKYQLPRSFRPEFKLFFATNVRPAIETNDQGFWRRIHEWPMMRTLAEDQIDVELKNKLISEAGGILAKIIAGWKDFWVTHNRRLLIPALVSNTVAEHRVEASSLAAFVSEFVEVAEPNMYVLAEEFHTAFTKWAGSNMSKVTLSRKLVGEFGYRSIRLKESGPDRDKRAFLGIRLREVSGAGEWAEGGKSRQPKLSYEQ